MGRTIVHRELTKDEVDRLINEAVPSETKFLRDLNRDIYSFFKNNSLVQDGILVDGRPIYIAALIRSYDGRLKFWTVVNRDTNSIISMSRIVRTELKKWVEMFGEVEATMEKVNPKNMKWVEWLGFRPIHEDNQYVTYKIGS